MGEDDRKRLNLEHLSLFAARRRVEERANEILGKLSTELENVARLVAARAQPVLSANAPSTPRSSATVSSTNGLSADDSSGRVYERLLHHALWRIDDVLRQVLVLPDATEAAEENPRDALPPADAVQEFRESMRRRALVLVGALRSIRVGKIFVALAGKEKSLADASETASRAIREFAESVANALEREGTPDSQANLPLETALAILEERYEKPRMAFEQAIDRARLDLACVTREITELRRSLGQPVRKGIPALWSRAFWRARQAHRLRLEREKRELLGELNSATERIRSAAGTIDEWKKTIEAVLDPLRRANRVLGRVEVAGHPVFVPDALQGNDKLLTALGGGLAYLAYLDLQIVTALACLRGGNLSIFQAIDFSPDLNEAFTYSLGVSLSWMLVASLKAAGAPALALEVAQELTGKISTPVQSWSKAILLGIGRRLDALLRNPFVRLPQRLATFALLHVVAAAFLRLITFEQGYVLAGEDNGGGECIHGEAFLLSEDRIAILGEKEGGAISDGSNPRIFLTKRDRIAEIGACPGPDKSGAPVPPKPGQDRPEDTPEDKPAEPRQDCPSESGEGCPEKGCKHCPPCDGIADALRESLPKVAEPLAAPLSALAEEARSANTIAREQMNARWKTQDAAVAASISEVALAIREARDGEAGNIKACPCPDGKIPSLPQPFQVDGLQPLVAAIDRLSGKSVGPVPTGDDRALRIQSTTALLEHCAREYRENRNLFQRMRRGRLDEHCASLAEPLRKILEETDAEQPAPH